MENKTTNCIGCPKLVYEKYVVKCKATKTVITDTYRFEIPKTCPKKEKERSEMIYQIEFKSDIEITKCEDCKFCVADIMRISCSSERKIIIYDEWTKNKPSWCPLKEVQNG